MTGVVLFLQILIKVFTIGVNPCETYARAGHFNVDMLPFIPGSDCAGVVVRIGSEVTKVKVLFSKNLHVSYCFQILHSVNMYCIGIAVVYLIVHMQVRSLSIQISVLTIFIHLSYRDNLLKTDNLAEIVMFCNIF